MISSGWLTMKVLRVAAKSARRWFCVRRPEKRWRSRDSADRFEGGATFGMESAPWQQTSSQVGPSQETQEKYEAAEKLIHANPRMAEAWNVLLAEGGATLKSGFAGIHHHMERTQRGAKRAAPLHPHAARRSRFSGSLVETL